jgi:hypothetical protein
VNTHTHLHLNTQQLALKDKILKAGIREHEKVIQDVRSRIKEMMTAVEEGDDEYDSHAQSFKEETTAEVSLLADQLQLANHELEELRKIASYKDTGHSIVEFGTVVRTDKGIFFVSAHLKKFDVDGETIQGISVQSPLYLKMKGKKPGEQFSHHGISHDIIEVF